MVRCIQSKTTKSSKGRYRITRCIVKNHSRAGFTLLEAAISLAIAGMVLLSFQGLVQVLRPPETDGQLQFLQTTDSLMRQEPAYQLQRVTQDAVFMRRETSSGNTDYRLEVHNNYLRFGIVGKSGQIILMRDVVTMQAQPIQHGFQLTIQTTKGEVYSGDIILPSDAVDVETGAKK